MKVDSCDISVIVQGAVSGNASQPLKYQITKKCLDSIRQFLPDSEIILSTWKGSPTEGLNYDVLVESDDPGAVLLGEHKGQKLFNNLNRQIVSTKAGLEKATRPYAVKMRSDMIMTAADFLGYYFGYPKRADELNILCSRAIVSSVYTPNPNRFSKKPFHCSDWFTFGLKDDVIKIWNVVLAKEPDFSTWFKNHPLPEGRTDNDNMLYRPEQYIWLNFLRKYGNIPCENQWDFNEINKPLHEVSFANNLIILHPNQIGIKFIKYRFGIQNWISFYHHKEWVGLYAKYCDPNYKNFFDWKTHVKNGISYFLSKSQSFRYVLQWYDYRYTKFTMAWNAPNRWQKLKEIAGVSK